MSESKCANCGCNVNPEIGTCQECDGQPTKKLSLTTWVIISLTSLVLAGPFIVLFFVPAEPPEDKSALLEQLEIENRRSGFSQDKN